MNRSRRVVKKISNYVFVRLVENSKPTTTATDVKCRGGSGLARMSNFSKTAKDDRGRWNNESRPVNVKLLFGVDLSTTTITRLAWH